MVDFRKVRASDYRTNRETERMNQTGIKTQWPLDHLITGPEIKWPNCPFVFTLNFRALNQRHKAAKTNLEIHWLDHSKTGCQSVQNSNVSGFWVSGIQIFTV
jgi:hypothetical protein